jgi:hypothetical protein
MLAAVAPGALAVEHLNAASVAGAVLVVAGSMVTTLAGRREREGRAGGLAPAAQALNRSA